MKLTVEKGSFRDWLEHLSFKEHGDRLEREHGELCIQAFPNVEKFWRRFVVPLTRRALQYPRNPKAEIHFRDGIDPVLQYISGANYSVFLHLTFAELQWKPWNDCSLDSIYTRLSSALDVFEALAVRYYLLLCRCRGAKCHLMQELSKDEFLRVAGAFYDKNYKKLYEHYYSIGKHFPLRLPSRDSILEEYFHDCEEFKNYSRHAQAVRQLRNAIVHDVRIGQVVNKDNRFLVPKPSVIMNYRSWPEVESASKDPELVKRDFAFVDEQAIQDIKETGQRLNALYDIILADLDAEFYSDDRKELRNLFGIEFGTITNKDSQQPEPVVVIEDAGSHTFPFVEAETEDSQSYRIVDKETENLGGNIKYPESGKFPS